MTSRRFENDRRPRAIKLAPSSAEPWTTRFNRFGLATDIVGPDYKSANAKLKRMLHERHDLGSAGGAQTEADIAAALRKYTQHVKSHCQPIASLGGPDRDATRSANARLMYAAPDLLAVACKVYELLREAPQDERGSTAISREQRAGLLSELAQAASKATGTRIRRFTRVDDRAPLQLWTGDRHLRKSKRRYRCRECNFEVGRAHDTSCAWLRRAGADAICAWPELEALPPANPW